MKGVILFGHGSRDAQWRAPMDAVAQRLAQQGIASRCAFLELQEPDLAGAAGELIAAGADRLVIVPMFLGTGRHAREDLPALVDGLRKAHPGLPVDLRPPVGEDARVLDLLARVAAQ